MWYLDSWKIKFAKIKIQECFILGETLSLCRLIYIDYNKLSKKSSLNCFNGGKSLVKILIVIVKPKLENLSGTVSTLTALKPTAFSLLCFISPQSNCQGDIQAISSKEPIQCKSASFITVRATCVPHYVKNYHRHKQNHVSYLRWLLWNLSLEI